MSIGLDIAYTHGQWLLWPIQWEYGTRPEPSRRRASAGIVADSKSGLSTEGKKEASAWTGSEAVGTEKVWTVYWIQDFYVIAWVFMLGPDRYVLLWVYYFPPPIYLSLRSTCMIKYMHEWTHVCESQKLLSNVFLNHSSSSPSSVWRQEFMAWLEWQAGQF